MCLSILIIFETLPEINGFRDNSGQIDKDTAGKKLQGSDVGLILNLPTETHIQVFQHIQEALTLQTHSKLQFFQLVLTTLVQTASIVTGGLDETQITEKQHQRHV